MQSTHTLIARFLLCHGMGPHYNTIAVCNSAATAILKAAPPSVAVQAQCNAILAKPTFAAAFVGYTAYWRPALRVRYGAAINYINTNLVGC